MLAIGEDAAHEAARAWGLNGLHDYKKAEKPGADPAANKEKKASRDNTWSAAGWSITKQGSVVKAMGVERAGAVARAAGSYIGATKPARV